MYKRKSILEEFLNILYELTGMFWVVGAVISIAFTLLGIKALFWGVELQLNPPSEISASLFASSFGYFYFILPVILFVVSYIFANKAYLAYTSQH